MGTFHKAKNRNFPKGLTHDLDQKIQIFSLFVFRQNKLKHRVSWCSEIKRKIFEITKIENFHKAKIRNFPKGLIHDFNQKFQIFLYLFFAKIILKIEFLHVLNKKETFLDHKNAHFSLGQTSQFSKGFNPRFGQKHLKFFFVCFLPKKL